jgi:membrane protein YdbS with pleckstrin-like domain
MESYEQPILNLKPNMLNAVFPIILANLFYAILFSSMLYGMLYIFAKFNVIDVPNKFLFSMILFFILSIIPAVIYLFILHFTTYTFFPSHVSKEFNFLILKKHSIPYNQITNIVTDITLWDKVSNAGNIVLHTAEEKSPNLVLRYLENPEDIEQKIYSIIKPDNSKN